MKVIADFHIHSKYSRAVSAEMEPEILSLWAGRKGINLLGTGDFTHPGWLKELKEKLEPAENGLFQLNSKLGTSNSKQASNLNNRVQKTRFVLTVEISCIYTKNNKTRKIHLLILAPDFHAVEKINVQLSWSSNISSDGRPILGMDAKDLTKLIFESDPRCIVIPAHIWTPWFSLFGSASGFDTIIECFEELSSKIFVFETGLSSDPQMNWQLSQLNGKTIVSNSDAHSPSKLGREANVFELDELNYDSVANILKSNDIDKFKYTIEFYPEEGKYHYDGHRKCDVAFEPKVAEKNNYLCPKCGKPLTIGVLHRVLSLSDQKAKNEGRVPFKNLIPLEEIIADVWDIGAKSKKVTAEYLKMTNAISEFDILINTQKRELDDLTSPEIVQGIIDAREGRVTRIPGYDGIFGIISVSGRKARKDKVKVIKEEKQMGLF